ncbi:lysophospholipid acyltransferase 7 [Ciconia boyciana]|uniref:lysophospholipid acyltransferase 7 n=1 Tax=Ciconia boyciana TaxID=52775 RepID=UPI003BA1D005
MTPEEVTYLAVLLCSIPIGFAFKGRGPRPRQLGGAAVGAGLTLVTCGPHALHSLGTTLGTWVLLRLLPRRCGGAALLWTFGYLLFFRTAPLWGLPPPPPYANALQLLLTLKMVSLASDVQELQEVGQKKVTSEEAEELIGCLQSCPGLVEILCYSYCYLGLLTGPFYRFSTHRDWVQGPLPAASWRRVLGRVRWVPALGVLGEAAGRLFPLAGVRDPRFGARPFAFRFFYMAPVFFAFRMRFYVGWLCAEAACLAAAFGAYPPAAHPRPGCGPTRPCPRPRRAEELPPELWDYETIRTTDPLGTERGRRFRQGLRRWNMTVQWWLARYVHRRAPRQPPALRSAWTMLVSAYWHGLHPGYYLSFLSVPLWLAAEGAAEAALGGRLGPRGRALAHGLQWFLKMRAYDYLCMGFVLLEAGATLRYWASVYFCLHLLPLLILLLAAVAGPGPGGGGEGGKRGPPPAEGGRDPDSQEEGGSPVAGDPSVRKRREPPTPGDPRVQEGGGTPIPGDPNIAGGQGEDAPAPVNPKVWEGGDTPTPCTPISRRGTPPPPAPQRGEGGGEGVRGLTPQGVLGAAGLQGL